jgi:opacity protein-like surface antigen
VRRNIDFGDLFEDVNTSDWGLTLGGGVTGMVSDNVGLRGDIRYIRSLEDPEDDEDPDVAVSDFDFWRATVGVVFRLP